MRGWPPKQMRQCDTFIARMWFSNTNRMNENKMRVSSSLFPNGMKQPALFCVCAFFHSICGFACLLYSSIVFRTSTIFILKIRKLI